LFNSFHHFQDGHAEEVLADAVKNGQGVAVFEVSRRRPLTILATSLNGAGSVSLPAICASLLFFAIRVDLSAAGAALRHVV
jgi:hypothetical protein